MDRLLLINLILWFFIIGSLITNNSAIVKFEKGEVEGGIYKKAIFQFYYSKLSPEEIEKTVLEEHEVLSMELCLTLGSAIGQRYNNDFGKKTCNISFLPKNITTRDFGLVCIKVGACECYGSTMVQPFYIREYYFNDDDILIYLVFKEKVHIEADNRPPRFQYIVVWGLFDAINEILYDGFLPIKNQYSKLPVWENYKENEEKNNNTNLNPPGF